MAPDSAKKRAALETKARRILWLHASEDIDLLQAREELQDKHIHLAQALKVDTGEITNNNESDKLKLYSDRKKFTEWLESFERDVAELGLAADSITGNDVSVLPSTPKKGVVGQVLDFISRSPAPLNTGSKQSMEHEDKFTDAPQELRKPTTPTKPTRSDAKGTSADPVVISSVESSLSPPASGSPGSKTFGTERNPIVLSSKESSATPEHHKPKKHECEDPSHDHNGSQGTGGVKDGGYKTPFFEDADTSSTSSPVRNRGGDSTGRSGAVAGGSPGGGPTGEGSGDSNTTGGSAGGPGGGSSGSTSGGGTSGARPNSGPPSGISGGTSRSSGGNSGSSSSTGDAGGGSSGTGASRGNGGSSGSTGDAGGGSTGTGASGGNGGPSSSTGDAGGGSSGTSGVGNGASGGNGGSSGSTGGAGGGSGGTSGGTSGSERMSGGGNTGTSRASGGNGGSGCGSSGLGASSGTTSGGGNSDGGLSGDGSGRSNGGKPASGKEFGSDGGIGSGPRTSSSYESDTFEEAMIGHIRNFNPLTWEKQFPAGEGYMLRPPFFRRQMPLEQDHMPGPTAYPYIWHQIQDFDIDELVWGLLRGKTRKNSLAFEVARPSGSVILILPPHGNRGVEEKVMQMTATAIQEVPYGLPNKLLGKRLSTYPPVEIAFAVGRGTRNKGDAFLIWHDPEERWFTKSDAVNMMGARQTNALLDAKRPTWSKPDKSSVVPPQPTNSDGDASYAAQASGQQQPQHNFNQPTFANMPHHPQNGPYQPSWTPQPYQPYSPQTHQQNYQAQQPRLFQQYPPQASQNTHPYQPYFGYYPSYFTMPQPSGFNNAFHEQYNFPHIPNPPSFPFPAPPAMSQHPPPPSAGYRQQSVPRPATQNQSQGRAKGPKTVHFEAGRFTPPWESPAPRS